MNFVDISTLQIHNRVEIILVLFPFSSKPISDPENRVKNPRGVEKDIESSSTEHLSIKLYIRP